MGKQPTKVDKIPEGYKFSHKDEATGRDIYKISTSTPQSNVPVVPPKPKVSNGKNLGKPSILRPPLPKRNPPTVNEDFVYMEPTVTTDVVNPNIPLYEDTRIDRKLQTPIHPDINYFQYPDPNAGYSKPINKYFDKATNQEIDINKSLPNGNYLPTYLDNALKVNEGANLGTEKQGNPRITTTPTITNVMEGVGKEKAGTKGASSMGTVGFKEGGPVKAPKIKKYATAGLVTDDTYKPNMNIDGSYGDQNSSYKPLDTYGSGVVGQNDQYAIQNDAEAKKAKDEEQKKNNQNKLKGVANTVGSGLGAYGSAYYNSQPTQNEGDATRNAALGATSQMGPIGGAIGGLAGIGDKIGKPIKAKKESMDSTGHLNNESGARTTAIGASFLSPSKALATRSSYAGGWTDISGKGYTKSLEDKAQSQLKQVENANKASKQQQAILARNNGDFSATITNPYNTSGATFDENQNLILADGQQFDPNRQGLKKGGGVAQMCAEGGMIKGKGGPKEDKINAKIKGGSFVVPAENAEVAEELREKVLVKAPKVKANLNQKGGTPVKLSNKEHLFTKEEKEELLEKGVNVNLLAPNAEVKEEVNEPIHNSKEEAMEKKSHIMFPDVIGLKDGGKVSNKTYAELITVPYSWKGDKQEYINAAKKAIRDGKVIPSDYKENKSTSVKAPSVTKSNKVVVDNLPSINNAQSALQVDNELRDVNQIAKQEASINNADEKQLAINEAQNKINEDYIAGNPAINKKRSGVADYLKNIDPTSFVGIGQTALGLNYLGKDKRPIDKSVINPTYDTNVNRAQNEAQYGFTPENKFLLEQQGQNALNDARFSARNFAGGNAGTAFNQERAAINQGWTNALNLRSADQDLRMEKARYADQQVKERANFLDSQRRRAFGDAMDTFQQKQQAGSELIGAGIRNTIGAYRYGKELSAQEEADRQANAYKTTI